MGNGPGEPPWDCLSLPPWATSPPGSPGSGSAVVIAVSVMLVNVSPARFAASGGEVLTAQDNKQIKNRT